MINSVIIIIQSFILDSRLKIENKSKISIMISIIKKSINMSEWINSALDCEIQKLEKCAKTMLNWLSGILNSFSSPITNGFTEGCNNKIKVLNRNAYGYRNFKRFRNHILHIFSHQKLNSLQKQATA